MTMTNPINFFDTPNSLFRTRLYAGTNIRFTPLFICRDWQTSIHELRPLMKHSFASVEEAFTPKKRRLQRGLWSHISPRPVEQDKRKTLFLTLILRWLCDFV